MKELVKSYLVHYGYIETLQAMEEQNQPKALVEENKEQEDHEMTDENQVVLEL